MNKEDKHEGNLLTELDGITNRDLRAMFQRTFEVAPADDLSHALMTMILSFEIQVKRTKALPREIKALRNGTKLSKISAPRKRTPSLKAGARLLRDWNGISHVIDVKDKGFEYKGQHYKSLTGIAKAITGAHWSGPRFFGLTKQAQGVPS